MISEAHTNDSRNDTEISELLTGAQSLVKRSEAAISCDLADEAVVLNLASGVYFGLGEVGSRIWKIIESPVSLQDICGALVSEYAVDAATCETSVLRFLQQLCSKGLAEIS